MSPDLSNDRSYAVALARRYFYERNVTLDTLVATFSETTDPLIERLVDLAIHEPARTGRFITVSQRDYERSYWPDVDEVLRELERGERGVLPELRPWSKKRIFWVTILAVFLGASATEHGLIFWHHMKGDAPLPLWSAALHLAAVSFMSCLVLAVAIHLVVAVRHRLRRPNRP